MFLVLLLMQVQLLRDWNIMPYYVSSTYVNYLLVLFVLYRVATANCTHSGRINSAASAELRIVAGVSQGGISSPILFHVYVDVTVMAVLLVSVLLIVSYSSMLTTYCFLSPSLQVCRGC